MERTATIQTRTESSTLAIVLKALLIGGVVSSLLYVASDILAAMSWEGYSYTSQAFSELLAIGAPTRPFMVAAANVYNLLVLAFGIGVWLSAGPKRSLRVTGILLVAYGLLSAAGPYVPMHVRGAGTSLTDVLHVVCTVGLVLSMLLFIAFGSATHGKAFRRYSVATILAVLSGGALAFQQGARIAAGQPTPWVGLIERVTIYSAMLWVAVLAITLLRAKKPELVDERR